jgi:hypothetical protein
MQMSPSWETASCVATQELPAFYGTWSLVTVFTRALHWSLSWARLIQSIQPHPVSLRSILILSTHLYLVLPSGFFVLAFSPISYMHSFSSHSCYISYPSHPPSRDHFNYTWRRLQVTELLIMEFWNNLNEEGNGLGSRFLRDDYQVYRPLGRDAV